MSNLLTVSVARGNVCWRIMIGDKPQKDGKLYPTRRLAVYEAGRIVCCDIMDNKEYGLNRRLRLDSKLYTPARRMGALAPYRQWLAKLAEQVAEKGVQS